ncbi:hypothetical protein EGW08_020852, partial [Elysia chlorotica]
MSAEGKVKKTASFKDHSEVLNSAEFLEEYVSHSEPDVDEDTKMRRDVLRAELAAMASKEENAKARWREKMKEEKKKAVSQLHKERVEKGFSILPGSVESKNAIRKVMKDEETIALRSKLRDLKSENDKIQAYIDDKLGITALPKGEELLSLAEDFYSNEHVPNDQLPKHIRLALTTEEIQDLRRVFELFDAKNK